MRKDEEDKMIERLELSGLKAFFKTIKTKTGREKQQSKSKQNGIQTQICICFV